MKASVAALAVAILLASPAALARPDAPSDAPSDTQTQPEEGKEQRPAQKAAPDETELAKKSQNPVSNLISIPIQEQFNFGAGPGRDRTQYVLNLQPVVPIQGGDDWLLVSRAIMPLISQPLPGGDRSSGLGDLDYTLFVTPAQPSGVTIALGPAADFPTATSSSLGTGKWSLGPSAVILTTAGSWVVGALAKNVWSYAGGSSRPDVSAFLVQPFVNYNLPRGWAITTSPIITNEWRATDSWIVPVGAGLVKTQKIGSEALQVSAAGYWNVVHPNEGPVAQFRLQVALLLPR